MCQCLMIRNMIPICLQFSSSRSGNYDLGFLSQIGITSLHQNFDQILLKSHKSNLEKSMRLSELKLKEKIFFSRMKNRTCWLLEVSIYGRPLNFNRIFRRAYFITKNCGVSLNIRASTSSFEA